MENRVAIFSCPICLETKCQIELSPPRKKPGPRGVGDSLVGVAGVCPQGLTPRPTQPAWPRLPPGQLVLGPSPSGDGW